MGSVSSPEAASALPLASFDAGQLGLWRRVSELWELSARKDDHRIREALHPDYVGWDMSTPRPHEPQAAQPVRVTGRWTEVYIKQGQRWLMVAVSGQPSRTEDTHAPSAAEAAGG